MMHIVHDALRRGLATFRLPVPDEPGPGQRLPAAVRPIERTELSWKRTAWPCAEMSSRSSSPTKQGRVPRKGGSVIPKWRSYAA